MYHWWKDAIFYELYIDKFAGNLNGLTNKLDYFSFLGVNCLHLLPHYPSPLVDDGYDVSDYRNVRSELGDLGDFRALTKEAHGLGIKILIDLVLNHVSSEHPWFREARSSKDNAKRDFFLWSKTGKELAGSTNSFSHMKPDNWIYEETTGEYYFTTFYPEQPDLNWDNPKVMEEMLAIMDFWIDLGVDGFRLDAAAHLVKREGTSSRDLPETHALLQKIRLHLEKNSPNVALLAEVTRSPWEYLADGKECHMVYHFPLAEEMLFGALRGDMERVHESVKNIHPIPENCQWGMFLRNHDEIAFRELTLSEREEMVSYADPSRQYVFKGEHGLSMRLGSLFKKDPERIRDAFKALFELPGAPIIYYGDEIGMENDIMVPPPSDTRRYVRGYFDHEKANEQMADPDSLLNYVAALAHRRKYQVAVETSLVPKEPVQTKSP